MDKQLLQDLEHLQEVRKQAADIGAFSFVANGKEYSPLSRLALGADYVGGKVWSTGKKATGIMSKGLEYMRKNPVLKHITPKKITPLGALTGAAMTAALVVPTMIDAGSKATAASGTNTARRIAKLQGWQG